MKKIPFVCLNYSQEQPEGDIQGWWDMQLVFDMLQGKVWSPGRGYTFYQAHSDYASKEPKNDVEFDGCVLVIPARHNVEQIEKYQKFIDRLNWVVLILCGDEERGFDYTKLQHANMKVWLMQPTQDDKADFYLGSGYTPDTRRFAKENYVAYMEKPLAWYFSGQQNHSRRTACVNELTRMFDREDMPAILNPTEGFTQGVAHDEYYKNMVGAKAIPAPSGIKSPDSFRLFEALECGSVPIADEISELYQRPGYWTKVFDQQPLPFKVINNYENMEGYLGDVVREYPEMQNRTFAWWQQFKRHMVNTLCEQIHEISQLPYDSDSELNKITVIIPTSPIPSHPSTGVIEETIQNIRSMLPDCEIIIGIDGVRREQEFRREDYEKYIQRLLWLCNYEWHNVLPVRFQEHQHQALMTKKLLEMVNTPLILFVEHDTGLTPDYEFEWPQLIQAIESGSANVIRFHHEGHIPPEHNYLMLGGREDICGIPMMKTMQWSQRPHLASTFFYREMLNEFVTDQSRTMIEDTVHGRVQTDCQDSGIMGWYKWRLWIYYPEGNIKRSYTTDGRKDDPKFDMIF